MTFRSITSALLATILLAAPVAASAAVKHKPMARHTATSTHRVKATKPMRAAPRDGGSAAVDALNQQSLTAARGGVAR